MNKIILVFFLSFILSGSLVTEAKTRKQYRALSSRQKKKSVAKLRRALRDSSHGRYFLSTKKLFLLMYNPALKKQQNKIRYHLALNLYNMKLYHPAIFQFQILVSKNAPGYIGKSLQKIALAASYLKDDRLLNHAISHGSLKYISRADRSNLHYQFGEYWVRKKKFRRAVAHFSRVKSSSPVFYKSLYQLGLVHVELNHIKKAINIFTKLENLRARGVSDNFRIAALLGKARSYYQIKNWNQSVAAYQKVPKDSYFWHDTLLEKSWALVRGGKLRSALSNFHTLHSSYYTDYYQPESLLLRGIIYLYICKYYEMEKVIELFEVIYKPIYKNVNDIIDNRYSLKSYYQSLVLSANHQRKGIVINYPVTVARRILREGDFSAIHYYITKLKEERDFIYKAPYFWRQSKIGKYSQKLIRKRLFNATKKAGKQAFRHLKIMQAELKDFFIQGQYLRYEMLRNKRGFLKKKIAQKITTGVRIADLDRSFYIQNGYEYWPFKNEYWLDELGNYHYIGKDVCLAGE